MKNRMLILALVILTVGAFAQEKTKEHEQDGLNPSYGMNEKFKLGNDSIEVVRCIHFRAIEPNFGKPTKAQEGVTFLLTRFSITNEGDETQSVALDYVKLRDTKGRRFSPSDRLKTDLIFSEIVKSEDLTLSQLQPGIKHTAVVVFEIPTESISGELRLIFNQPGDEASEQAEVRLDKMMSASEARKKKTSSK